MLKGKSKQDIDYIFENIVGGGGRWQWLFVVGCTFPIHLASCLPLLIHLFAAYEAKHRCYISLSQNATTFEMLGSLGIFWCQIS